MLINRQPKIYDVDAIGVAAVAAIIGVAWLLGVQPLERRIADCQVARGAAVAQQLGARSELVQLQSELERQNALVARLQKTRDLLKENRGLDHVIANFDAWAIDYGVRLDIVRSEMEQTEEHYEKTPIEVTLTGPFSRAMCMLAEATAQMPYVQIDTLGMTALAPGAADCEIHCNLHVFAPLGGANLGSKGG